MANALMFSATDSDLSAELTSAQATGLGFPILNQTEVPVCGVSGVARTCTRKGKLSNHHKEGIQC